MSPLLSSAPLLCLLAVHYQTDAACPQRGLCLVRGRNEPFQQRSQLLKALGCVQTPMVVTQGRIPSHKRGFGSGCSAQGGLSGSGAASERAGKNIWGGRGLGHEAAGCPAQPSTAAGRSGTLQGSVPAQRARPGEVTSIHARGALCWTEPRAATACTGQPVAVQGLGDRSSGTHKTQLFGAADTESWEQEPPRRVAVHEHVRRACERVRERAAPARRHGGSGAPAAPKLGAPSAAQSRG